MNKTPKTLNSKDLAEILVLQLIVVAKDLVRLSQENDIREHVFNVLRRELPNVPESAMEDISAMLRLPGTVATPAPRKVGPS